MNAQILNVSRILAGCAYIFVLLFLVIVNVFSSGIGLNNHAVCSGLVYTCLVFYGLIKLSLYLFMAERIHTVRSVELSRWQDKVWIATMVIEVIGLGTVIGLALGLAGFTLEPSGVCRVGIPNKATIAILCFDIPINLWLIGCFVWLLRPTLRSGLHDTNQMSPFARMVAGASLSGAPTPATDLTWASVDLESSVDHTAFTKPPQEVRVNAGNVEAEDGDGSNVRKPSLGLLEALSEDYNPTRQPSLIQQDTPGVEEKLSFDLAQLLADEPQLAAGGHQPLPVQQGHLRRSLSPVDFTPTLDESVPPLPPLEGHNIMSHIATTPSPLVKRLESLIKRNLLGTLILFLPIVINIGLYVVFHGKELAWLCLVMCSLDVTSSIAVLHWLTATPEETA